MKIIKLVHKESGKIFQDCKEAALHFNVAITTIYTWIKKEKFEIEKEINKKPGVNGTICKFEDCQIRASFGFKDGSLLFCGKHKETGMIDRINKRCTHEDCNETAFFNHKGEKRGLFCKEHKEEHMIDVKNYMCKKDDCEKMASFGIKGEKIPSCCKDHKQEDMIDIIHKKCEHDDCNVRPLYNHEGQRVGIFCNSHKEEGMVNVVSKKCKHKGCKLRATYGDRYEKIPLFCSSHKENEMINVRNQMCLTPFCDKSTQKKYKGYCLRCFCFTFPDEKIVRNYKTKENEVTQFVLKTFCEEKWIVDKIIQNGCSKRRPDLLLDLHTHVIVVEVDEDQHELYDEKCEEKRNMQILNDLNTAIVFIRFNPDKYSHKGIKFPSPWKTNSNGLYAIMNTQKENWQTRLDNLSIMIKKWINNIPEKTVTIEKLYYDIE